MNSRPRGSNPLIYLIILVAVGFLMYSFYAQRTQDTVQVPLTDVAAYVRDGSVISIRLEGDNLFVELRDGSEIVSRKEHESTVVEQFKLWESPTKN